MYIDQNPFDLNQLLQNLLVSHRIPTLLLLPSTLRGPTPLALIVLILVPRIRASLLFAVV